MYRAHLVAITSLGTLNRIPPLTALAASGELSVVVLDGDLVAEEPRRAGAGVGDQRLGLRQLQRELLVQELTEGYV